MKHHCINALETERSRCKHLTETNGWQTVKEKPFFQIVRFLKLLIKVGYISHFDFDIKNMLKTCKISHLDRRYLSK